MQLSKNFSLAELVKSQTAERKGIDNTPNPKQKKNLKLLCENILQPIRDRFGPFIVSSGFRCHELSAAVGSSIKSQHCQGLAVDFEVPGVSNYDLCLWIKDNLVFDQLILECFTGGNTGWIHCSYVEEDPRFELLTYDRVNKYRPGLIDDRS